MPTNRSNLIKSLQQSQSKILKEKKRHYFNRGIEFVVKDPLPKNINIDRIIELLRANIPETCYSGINNIYFGQFDILKKRDISALHFEDNIYVDNDQESEKEILDDLVHEFAHRFEENNSKEIYEDGKIVNEFLGKRNRLYSLLDQEVDINLNYFDFINVEYNKEFDFLLHKTIGYEKINNVAPTLFIRPYAATSVREYFATAFESYFLEGSEKIKNISPQVYNKLRAIDGLSNFNHQGE